MTVTPKLVPENISEVNPLCVPIDENLGQITIKREICFQLFERDKKIFLRVSWGSGEERADLLLTDSCQTIFNIIISDIELCISNIRFSVDTPVSFIAHLRACGDFPFLGHKCIKLFKERVSLGVLPISTIQAAAEAGVVAVPERVIEAVVGHYMFLYIEKE